MKCSKCGYDWSNSGDSAHVCGSVKVKQQEQRNVSEQLSEPVAWVKTHTGGVSYDLYHDVARQLPEGVEFDLYTTPQPKQEPVAEPHKGEPVAWMQDSIELYVQEEKDEKRGYVIPLYTTPYSGQQHIAERKPLTNENPLLVFAKECVLGAYREDELADAAQRAIKAAHGITKEKNT